MKRRHPNIVSFLGACILMGAVAYVGYLVTTIHSVPTSDADRQAYCIRNTPGTSDYVLQWCSDPYNWPAP